MKRLALMAVIVPLLLAACGGEPQTTGSPTVPPTETPTATPTESPTEDCDDQTEQDVIELQQHDNFFEPDCLIVRADQDLHIRNDGVTLHNFSVTGTSLDFDLQAGEESNTEAIGGILTPGTHDFFCKYHPGMVGVITVQ